MSGAHVFPCCSRLPRAGPSEATPPCSWWSQESEAKEGVVVDVEAPEGGGHLLCWWTWKLRLDRKYQDTVSGWQETVPSFLSASVFSSVEWWSSCLSGELEAFEELCPNHQHRVGTPNKRCYFKSETQFPVLGPPSSPVERGWSHNLCRVSWGQNDLLKGEPLGERWCWPPRLWGPGHVSVPSCPQFPPLRNDGDHTTLGGLWLTEEGLGSSGLGGVRVFLSSEQCLRAGAKSLLGNSPQLCPVPVLGPLPNLSPPWA